MIYGEIAAALAALVAALEGSGLAYALGGAAAYAVWAVPRATLDIDINVWCAPADVRTAFERLIRLGVEGDAAHATAQAEAMGVAYLRWRGVRLDVFVPSVPFYDEALRTRVRVEMPGAGMTWVLSAEALAVFKLMFFRPKDVLDLEKLVRIQGDALDAAYVRRQVAEMVGEDNERVVRWDRLLAEARPPR